MALPSSKVSKNSAVPGPKGWPLFGVLPKLVRDPFGFCMSAAADGDGLVRLKVGPVSAYLVSHPEYVRHILVANSSNYVKGSMMDGIRLALGNGLFTADGELWKRQRRLMQPAFHARQIQRMGGHVDACVEATMARLRGVADGRTPVDLHQESIRLNIEIVLGTLFGASVTPEQSIRLRELTDEVFHGMSERVWAFFLPGWLPTPGAAAYKRAIRALDALIYELINAHRGRRGGEPDLLDVLLDAVDEETGEPMSDRQIRDEIFTIFLAGYESTASAISWCCHLLTRNPDVRTRLRAEIGHLDHTRTPGFADLPDLPYGRRVIDETLRLFPAFPMYFRTSVGVDTIGPYRLPGKAKIVVSPYATHRDPRFWTEPTRFDPDRFSSDRFDAAARGAYYPFGKGNRVCVGERMSVVIAQVVVSAIVHGFDFEPAPGAVVEGRYAMSYQPRNGLPLILTAR